MRQARSESLRILPLIYRLLMIIALTAIAVFIAGLWYVSEHYEIDDIRYTYHAGSSTHISEIHRRLTIIKREIDVGNALAQTEAKENFTAPGENRITESIHIAANHAKRLNSLHEKYNVADLKNLIGQFNRLFSLVLKKVEPGGNLVDSLRTEELQAILLKLDQLERQHRISSARLLEQASTREYQQRTALGLFLGFIFLIVSVISVNVLRRINELIQRQQRDELALSEEKELLQTTLSSIGDAVITTDRKGVITSLNPVAEDLTGWSQTQAVGNPLQQVFPIIDATTREPIENPIDKVLASGETVYLSNHTTLVSRNGEEYQIADSAAPIRLDENDRIEGMVLVFNDVSEQYKLRATAAKNRRDLNAIMDFSPAVIQLRDLEGRYILVNQRFEKLHAMDRKHIIGHTPREIFPLEVAQVIESDDSRIKTRQDVHEIEESAVVAGREKHYVTTRFPLLDEDNRIYAICSISTDITDRKHQQEKIAHQAHFDALTELPNRFLSLDRLTQLLKDADRRELQVAVLFLDLDDFKKVNDTLGHETGDKLLVRAAKRLGSAVRQGDTVGRLGGDEFIILLGSLSSSSRCTPVVENLLEQFRRSFLIDGREMMLTASIGIALYPSDGRDASELLRNADSAMYHAKERGRNTYSYFTEEMNLEVSRRLTIEEQLHGAVDRGEFSVNYQPQVEVDSGRIVGAEALLRWTNPVIGAVSPADFIPIAEQTGQIIQLGNFVLEDAINHVAQWRQDYDAKFRVAVNLSPRQFRDLNLVPFIKHTLHARAVPAQNLELEITEGVLLSGHSDTSQLLNSLSELGISIAMDDFGTGYSSLSYLRQYPFDVLKIDRSFVSDINMDHANMALVSATIAMARALDLSVVAEGVETEAELKELKNLGCDCSQGYFISRPIPAHELSQFLARKPGQ